MSTKEQRAEFCQEIEKLIAKHGGKKWGGISICWYSVWTLETKFGSLVLRIDDLETLDVSFRRKWTGSIFGQFNDALRAHPHTLCNPYSGKWNHHYQAHYTVHEAILDFSRFLQLIAPLRKVTEEK